MTEQLTRPRATGEIATQALRRRTFAVISHPDAGKSTLTEALALHASAIDSAGAVHGKAGRKGVTSDWMEMERQRGISITSTVLQFPYRDHVINLLDTPGHRDFSEDTYRVLAAADAAVMVLDAAKGIEPQTLKLFEVCRERQLPLLTFINKWDRPGRDALELIDEVEVGRQVAPHIRVAFEVTDAAGVTTRLAEAGATVLAAPVETPWRSLNSRLDAPAGLQLTLFQELGAE